MLKFQLDNGLEVVLEENHAAPVVAFQAWVKAGAADEPLPLAGVSHFLEHMLFKGTARRGVGAIAREIESAGGEINAWTSYDETVFHLILASPFFDTGLDVLADALVNSSFDATELERERAVILEEIKQGLDDPDRVAAHALFDQSFAPHPYGRPVIGSVETVTAMTRDQIVGYHRAHYTGGNITLVIVGDFDADKARDKIAQAFASLPRTDADPGPELAVTRKVPPPLDGPKARVLARDVKDTQLLLGFRIPSIRHEDIPALDLIAVALGQGESSRLHLQVVRNQQKAKSAYSYTFAARDAGVLVVGAQLGTERPAEAARALLDEILALSRMEISQAELDRARTILESDRVFDRETVQGYARKLGYFAAIARDIGYEAHYLAALSRLTPSDLREVAARYLKAGQLVAIAQVPRGKPEQAERVAAANQEELSSVLGGAEARADLRTRSVAPAAPADAVVEHVLPGGTRVLVMRDPSVPIVAVRAMWVGGLRYEDDKTNGISNLIATLLTRGTRTRTAEAIAAEVESMAGGLSGFSGRNSIGLSGDFLARHWERGLELMADCLVNPTFADDELDKERRIVLDDIRAQDDNLAHSAFRLFHQALWKRHPYRLDALGTAESVGALGRRRLLIHFRKHYRPGNLTVAVVGHVDPAVVIDKLARLFPETPAELAERPQIDREPPPSQPAQVFQFMDREQAHVVLGFPGTTMTDADRFGLEVLSQILSGQGGRLFAELREKRGLVYRVSAFSIEGLDPGYFAVYLASSPDKLPEALASTRGELRRIVEQGVSEDELDRARRYLIGTHAIGLQRKGAIASALAFNEAYGQGWQEYRRFPERIQAVTMADLKRVAARYLDPARETVAVIKPTEETPAAARAAAR